MIAIKSKRIILPNEIYSGVVLIKDGLIHAIHPSVNEDNDLQIIDAGNKIVMPGVIDPHVHINEPGRTAWEGFDTATKAAIAGGVTTLVDMPLNASPVTTTVAAFHQKMKATNNQLHTNLGCWGGVIPDNLSEIKGLIDAGVLGFKAFLTHSGIDEFPNASEADLSAAMPLLAAAGLPLLVHCELTDDEVPDNQSPAVYANYLASRPKKWENKAIELMIKLCEKYQCKVHIVHLSSAEALPAIIVAKQKGLPITVETGQHYLFFTAEEIGDGLTQYKCAPPIREKVNNDLLWEALQKGVIDLVATDHSPATPELKELISGDFMKAWGGIASLQFALPVLWTAAKRRNAGVRDIAKWLCEKPAELIGWSHRKGKIAPGYDADLVIWDDDATFTVDKSMILHRHSTTPYLNMELTGVVEHSFVGGEEVYRKGVLTALNKGKIISPNGIL